jgi:hypothetical protein
MAPHGRPLVPRRWHSYGRALSGIVLTRMNRCGCVRERMQTGAWLLGRVCHLCARGAFPSDVLMFCMISMQHLYIFTIPYVI